MGFMDSLNYVLVSNPISQKVIDTARYVGGYTLPQGAKVAVQQPPVIPPRLMNLCVERIVFSGTPYIRLVGISGAVAVLLGAYGAHSLLQKPGLEEKKKIYETANRYHFIHTLALLGTPLSRSPKTSCSLLSLGMILFCGTCYYDAFSGDERFRKFTPIGGSLLVLGWLALVL